MVVIILYIKRRQVKRAEQPTDTEPDNCDEVNPLEPVSLESSNYQNLDVYQKISNETELEQGHFETVAQKNSNYQNIPFGEA